MKKILLLLSIAVLFAACSKRKTKKRLEGTWVATEMTATKYDGTSLDLIALGKTMEITFEYCRTNEGCPVTIILRLDFDTEKFQTLYLLYENGETMGIGGTFEEEITIVELTKDEFIFTTPSFVYGDDFYAKMIKQ